MTRPRVIQRPDRDSAEAALTTDYLLDIEKGGSNPNVPKTDPAFPFLLAYDPKRWRVFPTPAQVEKHRLKCESKVRPFLIPLKLVKGVQNVASRKDREGNEIGIDPSGLLLDQQRRGRIVLPYRLAPKRPGRARTYCVKVRGRPTYLNVFTKPIPGSRRVRVDLDSWARWLDWLVADGHLPPVGVHVLEHLDVQYSRAVDKVEERFAGLSHGAPAVARMRAAHKVVRDALDARFEELPEGEVDDVDFEFEWGDDDNRVPVEHVEGLSPDGSDDG